MSELVSRFFARSNPSHAAVIDDRGPHSYASVVTGAIRIAEALTEGRTSIDGERVGILISPSGAFVSAFFGILLAGGCVVVLSPLHPAPETRFFCEDANVSQVLVSRDLEEKAQAVLPRRIRIVEEILATPPQGTADPFPPAAEGMHALQLYTSGTTGKPKGAVLTHRNLGLQQQLVGRAWGFAENDTLLHALPLHHMHGLAIALLTALGAGATTRLIAFDARTVWNDLANATVFMGVPAMYHRLFATFDQADDATQATWRASAKNLRLATSGSAALPVRLAERWQELTGCIPLERFGMTEIGVGITNALDGERFPGFVGLPLATVETRIVGEDGNDATVGELWIRGPSVFAGYHRRDDETSKAFAADAKGGSPWFKTGDTVTRDISLTGAPFKILGRTSVDILKSGGYKLSALEIEEVLREHALVSEVAVVGLPDEAWGERVVACVVRRDVVQANGEKGPSDDTLASSLRILAKEKLAPYKIPKDILFRAELPKNALGKVVKPELVKVLRRR